MTVPPCQGFGLGLLALTLKWPICWPCNCLHIFRRRQSFLSRCRKHETAAESHTHKYNGFNTWRDSDAILSTIAAMFEAMFQRRNAVYKRMLANCCVEPLAAAVSRHKLP